MPVSILFDTETTGNGPKDRIIQMGGIVTYPDGEIECYDELCSCTVPISYEAMEVHHITPEMVAGKPSVQESRLYHAIKQHNHPDNYLIAHNIGFDLGMLTKEGFLSHFTCIDTVRCAQHLYPQLPSHRLQYLRYALGLYRLEKAKADQLEIEVRAHDAIGDVLVMKLLLAHLIDTLMATHGSKNHHEAMDQLVLLTTKPVLLRTFKFGKYKGEKIEVVATSDRNYLSWMRRTLTLDENLAYTLDYYLDRD
jgi:exodeoxyribonuclease X